MMHFPQAFPSQAIPLQVEGDKVSGSYRDHLQLEQRLKQLAAM